MLMEFQDALALVPLPERYATKGLQSMPMEAQRMEVSPPDTAV